ncbi:DUF885 family protein [Sphingomonas nostoxanthinifaciens]|uniref:DUF885 family protein n=1 Tax=Sphingomonas nostoxanthinifaciens TaxID=2872652 RepID=UPI001CC1D82E|nr:DUF885 family protein [Sphingomonas nostoxanthinifaciens]UAK23777.1 DUF885 domain-containing protein [Sphingomonas nostoxanthinifaciens]
MSAAADLLLAHHLAFRPVDASFMGIDGHDHRLPDVSAGAADAERRSIAATRAALADLPEIDDVGARLDRKIADAQLALGEAALDHLPRFANPAWYSGEAAFAIVSLLLPSGRPTPRAAVRARLETVPDFLADARARLADGAAPHAWTQRAMREAEAMAAFLDGDIRLHADWDATWAAPAAGTAAALRDFGSAIANLPDAPSACGHDYLQLLMQEGHGLTLTPEDALAQAEARFAQLGEELTELAASIDATRTADAIIGTLSSRTAPSADAVIDRYRSLDTETRACASNLVTTANDYQLDYLWLDPCFHRVAQALYFLPYRSPPADAAGRGSVYWVAPPPATPEAYLRANNDANVRIIHAVHHGSVGHHTQNARARTAASRLAQVAGTDCALGLAFLSSGTMVEGWACYVQDMMQESPGFYTDAERVYLKQMERRNVASIIVDIRLATGAWSPTEAAAFYRDKAGFAPERVDNEVTRNAMLPGTRLMYALGVDHIRALRTRWRGSARDFHDRLIGYGHVPVAWAGDEMSRAGLIA